MDLHKTVDGQGPSVAAADVLAVRGAIALVASGVAVDVILCGLIDAEAAADEVEPEAIAAGVPLHLLPGEAGGIDLGVGPRER
jgi:hypothetical protein